MAMADNEIIKALEYHEDRTFTCELCPLFKDEFCASTLAHNSLELIKRQKAEIESKQFRCDSCDRIGLTRSEHIVCIKRAKTEAIKEFADRLKEEFRVNTDNNGDINSCYVSNIIDNLIKEMTGKEV